jgi:RNA polymerase sigma-70 factor (ECF subfamily)
MVRMVGPHHAADVTQQVFLEVFQKIGSFRGLSRFETWLFRVAVNEAYGFLRREKRWKHQSLVTEPLDERTPQDDPAESKQVLDAALQRVDAESRSIFLLREVEGLSYQELSTVLEIPEGTVASRLNRARRDLRHALAELGWS